MEHFGRKMLAVVLAVCLLFAGCTAMPALKAEAKENVVVCIDPGHGGSNEGAKYNGLIEKNLTLQIATAMYQELSQYEGITVVMTRTDDKKLSLKERADIAATAGADFLFSIHLNASPDHNLFGSEVWTSGFGNDYAKGMTFGNIELQQLSEDIGVYPRGVKTKLNGRGSDYYGVIDHAHSNGIPAVIIEHCHMDEAHDKNFYMQEGALQKLGKADATAVAKYYKLKSSALGVDYSGYQYPVYQKATVPMMQDITSPEFCEITLTQYNKEAGQIQLYARTYDSESRILYYNYSLDGGASWSVLWGWAPPAGEGDIILKVPQGYAGEVCINAWNQYNGFTESNHIVVE